MIEKDIEITWQIEDGYVGHGPHHVSIPRDEWDECETQQEKDDLAWSYVQTDFENTVSYFIVDIDEED